MSGFGKRVTTIGVLIAGSSVAGTPDFGVLYQERAALAHSQRIAVSRRYLVQIVHTTRLLDSFLKCYLPKCGIRPGSSLGSHLVALQRGTRNVPGVVPTIAALSNARRQHFQVRVVNVRNTFMHEAGAFPTNDEADDLLADMLACLSEVLAL